nr:uncharacterized protein LOC109174999 [Ipomoea batatas]
MGCGESKHATATANTAITKRSSSSRTNSSRKETPPLVQQQPEAPGNEDGTNNPPQSAPQKGDINIIHIIKESKGEGEKALEAAKESKNGEGVEGANLKETIDKAKVEEKENNGAQAKEGSLEQNEGVNTNEEYSCF